MNSTQNHVSLSDYLQKCPSFQRQELVVHENHTYCIGINEQAYTTIERIARVIIGILATAFSLGFAFLSAKTAQLFAARFDVRTTSEIPKTETVEIANQHKRKKSDEATVKGYKSPHVFGRYTQSEQKAIQSTPVKFAARPAETLALAVINDGDSCRIENVSATQQYKEADAEAIYRTARVEPLGEQLIELSLFIADNDPTFSFTQFLYHPANLSITPAQLFQQLNPQKILDLPQTQELLAIATKEGIDIDPKHVASVKFEVNDLWEKDPEIIKMLFVIRPDWFQSEDISVWALQKLCKLMENLTDDPRVCIRTLTSICACDSPEPLQSILKQLLRDGHEFSEEAFTALENNLQHAVFDIANALQAENSVLKLKSLLKLPEVTAQAPLRFVRGMDIASAKLEFHKLLQELKDYGALKSRIAFDSSGVSPQDLNLKDWNWLQGWVFCKQICEQHQFQHVKIPDVFAVAEDPKLYFNIRINAENNLEPVCDDIKIYCTQHQQEQESEWSYNEAIDCISFIAATGYAGEFVRDASGKLYAVDLQASRFFHAVELCSQFNTIANDYLGKINSSEKNLEKFNKDVSNIAQKFLQQPNEQRLKEAVPPKTNLNKVSESYLLNKDFAIESPQLDDGNTVADHIISPIYHLLTIPLDIVSLVINVVQSIFVSLLAALCFGQVDSLNRLSAHYWKLTGLYAESLYLSIQGIVNPNLKIVGQWKLTQQIEVLRSESGSIDFTLGRILQVTQAILGIAQFGIAGLQGIVGGALWGISGTSARTVGSITQHNFRNSLGVLW